MIIDARRSRQAATGLRGVWPRVLSTAAQNRHGRPRCTWLPGPDDLSGTPSLHTSLEGGSDCGHRYRGAARLELAELLGAVLGHSRADGVDPDFADEGA